MASCAGSTPSSTAETEAKQPDREVKRAETTTFAVEAGGYAAAFDRAKRVLRDAGFILERVDAWSGVITTRPKGTAGLATIWDEEQLTVSQELDDLFNRHRRVVRITFRPGTTASTSIAGETATDLRALAGPFTGFVHVTLERLDQPGWRLDTNSIRASTYCSDPAKILRSMEPQYVVASAEDRLLGERYATLIAEARSKPE